MPYIDQISMAVLILIRVGAAFRAVYCLIRMMTAEEEAPQYRKRLRNTIIFYIIAELAFVIRDLAIHYYS